MRSFATASAQPLRSRSQGDGRRPSNHNNTGYFECVDAEVLVESSSPPPSASVSAHPLLMSARLAHPTQCVLLQGTPSPEGLATRDLIVIPSAPTALQLHHAIHQYYCPSCEPPPGRLITLALRGSQCTVENVREELLVSDAVVEVRAEDSSGQSSPSAADQHHYITVQEREGVGMGRSGGDERDLEGSPGVVETTARRMEPRYRGYYSVPPLCENGVGYHVQYVESQEIYSQPHHTHMDPLRTYPVYTSSAVPAGVDATEAAWVNAGGGGGGGGAGGADTFAYGAVVATDEARSAPDPPRAAAASPSAHRTPPATLTWLIDNYETAEGVSLPRSTLYAHYLRHCTAHDLEPVNAASFGKLIRSVFLGLRTRRLGTRGNSKYHYYGIRAKLNAAGVVNDDVGDGDTQDSDTDDKGTVPRHRQSAEARGGASGSGGSSSGEDPAHRQGLAAPVPPELPALELTPPLPSDISDTEVELFRRHYVEHSSGFLDAVTSLELTNVERTRREFWRRVAHEDDNSNCALSRRALHRLISRKDVASWLRSADLALYQRAVELLLPDVLRPIASSLTQSIRNFAKTLESAVASATAGLPTAAVRACADAASALAAALRRYTSLNHLAQAARAVLHNSHQIHQMLTDLNRVDFRVVREQAAWACACGKSAAAHDLETDFKATLGRGATLEQWASWLERAVRTALGSSERRVDYSARARRFLLHWSFYSSLVIRELTLRSAASFGSFHLIRLLYDEYVAYLVEQRVADHEGTPPIAVMHRASEEEEEEEEEEGEEEEWEWVEGDAEGEDEDMPADKKLKTE